MLDFVLCSYAHLALFAYHTIHITCSAGVASALDTLTEKSVQKALDRLGEHRTVLVIAHRLGTIRHADNILVLEDGRVVEQGTHDELLARNGVYAEMWETQLHSTSSRVSQSSLLG